MSNIREQFKKDIDNIDDDKFNLLKNTMDKLNNKEYPIIINKRHSFIKKATIDSIDRSYIDTMTPKYCALLEYVNGILKNSGLNEINELTQFKDIDKNKLTTDANNKLLNKMAPNLFTHFDKYKCGWYRKTPNIVVNVLRGILKQLGLKLAYRQLTRTVKSRIVQTYLYTII